MARDSLSCATAGCENSPRIGHAFCDRCEGVRATAQRATDEQDPTTLFGSAPRASLPEHMAQPVAGIAVTSKKAADAVADGFRTRKHLIHQHIQQEGATGATRPEIAKALGISVNSVNSAANTLYRQGLIASNPDHERPDPISGQACAVLVDEAHVLRWRNSPRRFRSLHLLHAHDGAGDWTPVGECDLVNPHTGETMSLRELARYCGPYNGEEART